MDARLVILGVSILVITSGFMIYGLVTGDGQLTGSSLSGLVLGLVFISIGLTYRDPLGEALKVYSNVLSSALVNEFEDLGYLGGARLFTCVKSGKIFLVFSSRLVPCNVIRPGLGVSGETPYLSFAADSPSFGSEDFESFLMKLGLSQVAILSKSDKKYVLELHGLRSDLIGENLKPLNVYQILVPLYLSAYLGKNIILEKEDLSENTYRAIVRVIEN